MKSEGLEEFMEQKPGGVAIHWRGREVLAGHLTHKVKRVWSTLGDWEGLRLVPFDCGIEIAVNLRNKGDAVRTVLSETGADAAIAYLGDDTTDEDAFAALQGRGLNLLVRD
jgi:trehalose 6-phosphate phosphatase